MAGSEVAPGERAGTDRRATGGAPVEPAHPLAHPLRSPSWMKHPNRGWGELGAILSPRHVAIMRGV